MIIVRYADDIGRADRLAAPTAHWIDEFLVGTTYEMRRPPSFGDALQQQKSPADNARLVPIAMPVGATTSTANPNPVRTAILIPLLGSLSAPTFLCGLRKISVKKSLIGIRSLEPRFKFVGLIQKF